MTATHVWVYNPETDAKWQSPADYVPIALARGWELTDPPEDEFAEPKDAPAPQPKASTTPKPRARKSTAAKSAKPKE